MLRRCSHTPVLFPRPEHTNTLYSYVRRFVLWDLFESRATVQGGGRGGLQATCSRKSHFTKQSKPMLPKFTACVHASLVRNDYPLRSKGKTILLCRGRPGRDSKRAKSRLHYALPRPLSTVALPLITELKQYQNDNNEKHEEIDIYICIYMFFFLPQGKINIILQRELASRQRDERDVARIKRLKAIRAAIAKKREARQFILREKQRVRKSKHTALDGEEGVLLLFLEGTRQYIT